MLDAQAVRAINEEVLHACLLAHARHGFSGDLEFSQGRSFAGGELIFWKRTDVHREELPEKPDCYLAALEQKWPSIRGWLSLPHSALLVYYSLGKITKHQIETRHSEGR